MRDVNAPADLSLSELDAVTADLAKSVGDQIERDVLASLVYAPFPWRAPEIEVYKPEPWRPTLYPWYDGVVVNAPVGFCTITACDSSDPSDESTTYLSTLSARSRAKASRAARNSRRALACRDMRRARHWLGIAEKWVERRISGISPIPAKSVQTPPISP